MANKKKLPEFLKVFSSHYSTDFSDSTICTFFSLRYMNKLTTKEKSIVIKKEITKVDVSAEHDAFHLCQTHDQTVQSDAQHQSRQRADDGQKDRLAEHI